MLTYTITRRISDDTIEAFNNVSMGLVGSVNDFIFETIPAGLCLYLGSDAAQTDSSTWTVRLNFLIKKCGLWLGGNGHNKIWNPRTRLHEAVTIGGEPFYPIASLDPLIGSTF